MKFTKVIKADMKSNPQVQQELHDIEDYMNRIKNSLSNMIEQDMGDLNTLEYIHTKLLACYVIIKNFDK